MNGAEENIVEVADDESGDLFTVADVMVNDYKIDSGSSIAIIDYYYLYSSIATVESKNTCWQILFCLILKIRELIM